MKKLGKKSKKFLIFSSLMTISGLVVGASMGISTIEHTSKTNIANHTLIPHSSTTNLSSSTYSQTFYPDVSINLNTSAYNTTSLTSGLTTYANTYGSVNNANSYYGPTSTTNGNYGYLLALNANDFTFNNLLLPYWTSTNLINAINNTSFNTFMDDTLWQGFISNILNNLTNLTSIEKTTLIQDLSKDISFQFSAITATNSYDQVDTNINDYMTGTDGSSWYGLKTTTATSSLANDAGIQNGVYLTYNIIINKQFENMFQNGVFSLPNNTTWTGPSFLSFLGVNWNAGSTSGNNQIIPASIAINNLAVSLNTNAMSYFPGLSNDTTITSSLNESTSMFNIPTNEVNTSNEDIWLYNQAWQFNSNNINTNVAINTFNSVVNARNYVSNLLFQTNAITNTGDMINDPLISVSSVTSTNQTANNASTLLNTPSVYNGSQSVILLGNTGFYFTPNTSYSINDTNVLKNYMNNTTYTMPQSITLSNLNIEVADNTTLVNTDSTFINSINATSLSSSIKYKTAYETYYDYINQKILPKNQAITNFDDLAQTMNNLSNPILATYHTTLTNFTPSLTLQTIYTNPINQVQIINTANNTATSTGFSNASSFVFNVNNDTNRFIEMNRTSVSGTSAYFIVNSSVYNNMNLNTLSYELYNNDNLLPFNSMILYNLNSSSFLPSLDLKTNDAYALQYNTSSSLNNIDGLTWKDFINITLTNMQNKLADEYKEATSNMLINVPASYYYWFSNKNAYTILANGYSISTQNGQTYLNVPIKNNTGSSIMLNGTIIAPNDTGSVPVLLTGYIMNANLIWLIVTVVILLVIGIIGVSFLLMKKKKPANVNDYINTMDSWRKQYFTWTENAYIKNKQGAKAKQDVKKHRKFKESDVVDHKLQMWNKKEKKTDNIIEDETKK